MAYSIYTYQTWKDMFKIDKAKVRTIYDILHDRAKKINEPAFIKVIVFHEDHSVYETTDIEEVLADHNAEGREIDTLCIELHLGANNMEPNMSTNNEKSDRVLVSIAFERSSLDKKVRYRIQNNDQSWVDLLSKDLNEQISRFVKTNRIFGSISPSLIDPLVFVFLAAVAITFFALYNTQGSAAIAGEYIESMSINDRTIMILEYTVKNNMAINWHAAIAWVATVIGIVFAGLRPISRIIQWANHSVFYWGDCAAKYDKIEKRKSNYLWGIFVTLIITFGSSLFLKHYL